jgi:hypothetical protein
MNFKPYRCDFGIKYNGVDYRFDHVQSYVIEDPEMTRLTRGANAGNKTGLAYKEGVKDPKRVTVTIMDMSVELKQILDQIYDETARVDTYCIDRDTGSSKMGRNCVLSQQPQQLNLDETPDSLNVALTFETFDLTEVFKS